jgi:uncharacterized DUF497 family protein
VYFVEATTEGGRLGGERMDFDWDEANRGHIAQHGNGIRPEEAEQVMANRPVDTKVQLRGGEERYLQVGETDAGCGW